MNQPIQIPVWALFAGAVFGLALVAIGGAVALPIGRQLGAGEMAYQVVNLENTADSLRRQTRDLPHACGLPLPSRTK